MSALYGSLSGERGEATKAGRKALSGHIRGWTSGVRVEARHGDDGDTFAVYVTAGSLAGKPDLLIGRVEGDVFKPSAA